MPTHFLILGASRGLGDALNRHLPQPADTCWLVSRQSPALALVDGVTRHWIQADLAKPGAAPAIAAALDGAPLDVVIYNAGIWEDAAFSEHYRFDEVSDEEDARVLAVNLTGALPVLKRAIAHLRGRPNPKIILIGSVNGLPYVNAPEVAYNASKFGLRGVAHGLRSGLRRERIAVTIINPGSFGEPGPTPNLAQMPHADLVELTRSIIKLSNATVVREVDVVAMDDPF